MRGILIHINGWPGAGKYTLGRIAAERIGARLVPNHAINGPGFALADFGAPAFRRVVPQVRTLVYDEIVRATPAESFILTTVLIEDPDDAALFAKIEDLASRRACPFLAVTLHCAIQQNFERLRNDGRAMRCSLTDGAVLRALRDSHLLLQPPCHNRLDLDTSTTAPSDNAARIVEAARTLMADAGSADGLTAKAPD